MKTHEHLEKLIPLYLYDELNENERKELEVHLGYCEHCHKQFEEIQALHKKLDKKTILEPSDALLSQSRLQLRNRLREEQQVVMKESWWQKLLDAVNISRVGWQLVGATAFLLVGLFLGRFVWAEKIHQPLQQAEMATNLASEGMSSPLISNIDLIQYNAKSGQVTIQYKSVNDVLVQGNIDDASVRRILAHAIRDETHPGLRLTAVKVFGGRTFSDDEVEQALIYALEHDTVDGVRLKAAKVLKTLPISQKIKEVFIRILLKDSNPAIRIEAVEALSKVKEEEDVVPIFQEASQDDENEFIRLKASKELERRENPKLDQNEGAPKK
ncbi:MAG: HEAT repeat domain-containing protein [bacterium]